jgi:rubrerythrin
MSIKNYLSERIDEMFATSPTNISKISSDNKDKQILRMSIIAEFDAINLYEQFADQTSNTKLRKILLDIAREEKVHIGEFEALLEEIDVEHEPAEEEGEEEVEELT